MPSVALANPATKRMIRKTTMGVKRQYLSTTLLYFCWIAALSAGPSAKTTVAAALSLSPLQSLALGSRLSSIQQAIRREVSKSSTTTTEQDLPALIHTNNNPTIIFPGAGGPDVLTSELLETINKHSNQDAASSIVWDWQKHRGSIATAAFDGEAVGEALAEATIELLLRKKESIESIHIVGISVGAFCANAMASTLHNYCKNTSGSAARIQVRLTLLDPFCTRGLIGIGYGAKNFGVKADYAQHYVNTDDPVPSTNAALPNCYCIDVTNAPERDAFVLPEGESMHCWPLAYLARHAGTPDEWRLHTHEERPRGAVEVMK